MTKVFLPGLVSLMLHVPVLGLSLSLLPTRSEPPPPIEVTLVTLSDLAQGPDELERAAPHPQPKLQPERPNPQQPVKRPRAVRQGATYPNPPTADPQEPVRYRPAATWQDSPEFFFHPPDHGQAKDTAATIPSQTETFGGFLGRDNVGGEPPDPVPFLQPQTAPSKGAASVTCFRREPPVYPSFARQRKWEGTVILRFAVLQDETIGALSVKRSSGYDVLDEAATVAVKQWRCSPANAQVELPLTFEIQPHRF